MKYFVSIMKYIALAILMANICMIIYYLFFGDVIDIVISVVLGMCLYVETYVLNKDAKEVWNNE